MSILYIFQFGLIDGRWSKFLWVVQYSSIHVVILSYCVKWFFAVEHLSRLLSISLSLQVVNHWVLITNATYTLGANPRLINPCTSGGILHEWVTNYTIWWLLERLFQFVFLHFCLDFGSYFLARGVLTTCISYLSGKKKVSLFS